MTKNSQISIIIILCFSILLITGSPFHASTNLSFENNSSFPLKEIIQFAKAQDDGGDNGGDDGGDGGDNGGDDGGDGGDNGGDDGGEKGQTDEGQTDEGQTDEGTGTGATEATTGATEATTGATERILESQGSNQPSTSTIDEAKVQQVVDKINNYVIQEEEELPDKGSVDLKNTITTELKNNPNGVISNSLEVISGIEEFIESEDEAIKQIAKMILNKYPEEGSLSAAILAPIIANIVGDNWNNILDIEIDDYDDKGDRKYNEKDGKHHHHHTIKKIIKYKNNKCITQTGSISLTGKIGAKIPILLGDFYPCEINGGRATLNVPNTADLQFVAMHLDRKNGNHEGIAIDMKKIKNLADNNALFVINFSDKMKGKHPITGKEKILEDINAIALFNKSKRTIDFKSGNSLAISAVLKS